MQDWIIGTAPGKGGTGGFAIAACSLWRRAARGPAAPPAACVPVTSVLVPALRCAQPSLFGFAL